MKLPLKHFLFIFILGSLLSCTFGPKPIIYNEDQCSACKMIISDKKFGAELVTKKGKVYKFDAIECLIPTLIENGEDKYQFILVTDYLNPGTLINAKESSFLVSKNLPSPMGGNLSSYLDLVSVKHAYSEHSGEILDWTGIKTKYKK